MILFVFVDSCSRGYIRSAGLWTWIYGTLTFDIPEGIASPFRGTIFWATIGRSRIDHARRDEFATVNDNALDILVKEVHETLIRYYGWLTLCSGKSRYHGLL